ncbi:MAG: glycosyltransferase, partial [Caulobacteraceae bacterium]
GAPRASARAPARRRLELEGEGPVWLWMGLQPKTKGLDRALAALAGQPDARLMVLGLDSKTKTGEAAARLARRLGVARRLLWLGFVSEAEAAEAMAAADLLLHPSRADVTGTVILEALANGLPAIATAVCGYSEHIQNAGAGLVLPEPFRAANLAEALRQATPRRLAAWSDAALAYTRRDDLFTGLERAADLILDGSPRP